MNVRRVVAILLKDLRDAGRDGRILVLLALPIGMAVFYNATIGDDDDLPETNVAIVSEAGGGGALARELRAATGKSVDLKVRTAAGPDAARKLVAADDVELAVVQQASAGTPRALVLVGRDASPTTQSVAALVPDALARASGSVPAAQTRVVAVAPADEKPYQSLEPRALTVLIVIVMFVAFAAMMVVPMQTAEELETGTYGALRLAATGPEILAAKAIAGLVYSLGGVALTLVLTQLDVADPVLFFGATVALTVSLVGFGLLLGLLVRNANTINTYGAFLLFPLVGLAAAAFFVESGVFVTIVELLPFSQAAMLLGDSVSAETPFHAGAPAWLVIGVWSVAGYAILARMASRREL